MSRPTDRDPLSVEVRDVPIRMVDHAGREREGGVFLHLVGNRAGRPETLLDRLNDPEARFVPLRCEGEIELVQLDWIAYFATPGRPPEVTERDEIGAAHEDVALELPDGTWLRGELVYARPPGSRRVLDLLNGPTERFLLLVTPEETIFVHRAAIVRARSR